jgi:membrane associated rhomboid family serine protease
VLPVGDDIARARTPALAPALALAGVVAAVIALVRGDGWTALAFAASALWLAAYGPSVEGTQGRGRFVLTIVSGALGGVLIASGLSGDPRFVAAAAAGTTSAVIATHLAAHRGARVLSLQLVPPFTGFVAVPAWAWALVWTALTIALAALGAFRMS